MVLGALDIPLQNAVTAAQAVSLPVDVRGRSPLVVHVMGAGTIASGVVTIEEAPTSDYSGTWSPITTVRARW